MGNILQLCFALLVTIGLFLAMIMLMKKFQFGTGRGNALINVVSTLPLGSKERILLLNVAGELIVVGSSPGGISTLHVLDRATALQVQDSTALADTVTTNGKTTAPFSQVLDLIRRGGVK